jgi:Tfp pilus assembly protein PilF
MESPSSRHTSSRAAFLQVSALVAALVAASATFGQEGSELPEGTRALYRGDYAAAAVAAEQFLKRQPRSVPALVLLARAYIAEGRFPLAFEKLRQAFQHDPRNADLLYYLGRLSAILSQQEYEELYRMAPGSARVHQLMAETYLAQEDKAKAEEEYRALLKIDPNSLVALDALGDLKRSQFQFEEAIKFYTRAQTLQPGDYDSAYGLGAAYLYRQDLLHAIEQFRKALEIDPRSAAAHLALGDALLRGGKAEEAVAELNSAIALEPRMRQAFTLLARAYQRLGKTDAASEALKKSEELNLEELRQREGLLERQPSPPTDQPPQSEPKP